MAEPPTRLLTLADRGGQVPQPLPGAELELGESRWGGDIAGTGVSTMLGAQQGMMGRLSQGKQEFCVELLEVDIKSKKNNDAELDPLLGQIESGASLKIRGFLLKGILLRTHDYWGRTSCVIQAAKSQIEIESAWFDERLAKLSAVNGALTEQLEVYLLPVVDTVDRVEGLLLCATVVKGGKGGWYRRIGVFDISRYDQIAWGSLRENMRVGDETLGNWEGRERVGQDDENGRGVGEFIYTINLV